VNGWDVRPTLDRAIAATRQLAQAAGSFVTGSTLPRALIQSRQRLTYELRLRTLVIPSWSAPQPMAGDSAVAQPTSALFTGLVRAPELTGEIPPRHIRVPHLLRAKKAACRAVFAYAPSPPDLPRLPRVAPSS